MFIEHNIEKCSHSFFEIQLMIRMMIAKEDEAFSMQDKEDAKDPAHNVPLVQH